MASHGALAAVWVIAVRLDPRRLAFRLDTATRNHGLRGAWSIDSLAEPGAVAFNAGQFTGGFPWGWLVLNGNETQAPGTGTLGMAFALDSVGVPSLVTPNELSARRSHVRFAFQSYPMLLNDGAPPWELRRPGRGINLQHRDARLALGMLSDGSIVVALTRFAGAGRLGETLPFGPTVPEMAEFMQSLGCRRAMLLDGGISSQLTIRDSRGAVRRWANWRAVPLALIAEPRPLVTASQPGPRN